MCAELRFILLDDPDRPIVAAAVDHKILKIDVFLRQHALHRRADHALASAAGRYQ